MSELHARIRVAAASSPAPLVSDRRDARTLAEALGRAEDLAAHVAGQTARSRPVVLATLPASLAAVELVLAAAVGDFTVCLVDPAGTPGRAAAIEDALDPDLVVDQDSMIARRPTSDGPPASGYVAMSSGTTGGPPKGVLSTWDCIADFATHGAAALRLGPGDRIAEPSHPGYDLAMTNWLLALTSGASLAVSSALSDRMRPLSYVARTEASHVRLTPRFIDLALADRERSERPHALRVWASGGDRLSPGRAATVFDLGIPALINTYGTSETAGFASAVAFDGAGEVTSHLGSVSIGDGRVGPWRTELVVEEHAGTSSEMLAIRAPHLRTGYLTGAPAPAPDGVAAYPRWEQDRVVTGDLGWAEDGRMVCLGRSGRLVKRSGLFVNLDDLDRVLRDVAGVDAVTVAIPSGELVTLAVCSGPDGVLEQARLGDLMAAHVAPDSLPDVILPVARVPRLANGKTDQAGAVMAAERAVRRT